MRVLLVEDNPRVGPILQHYFIEAGFTCDLAHSISEFWELDRNYAYDVHVIDLGLPDGDGSQIIRDARDRKRDTPIIVTSARGGIADRISALDMGADDYLVKPFHHGELLARVRSLLRRPVSRAPETIQIGNLVLNCIDDDVHCEGRRIVVRPTERQLLSLLIRCRDQPVSKDTIYANLIRAGHEVTPNALEKVVSRLRASLMRQAVQLQIATIPGMGYLLRETL